MVIVTTFDEPPEEPPPVGVGLVEGPLELPHAEASAPASTHTTIPKRCIYSSRAVSFGRLWSKASAQMKSLERRGFPRIGSIDCLRGAKSLTAAACGWWDDPEPRGWAHDDTGTASID